MTRRKAPAQVAPASLPEAILLLGRYAHIAAAIAETELLRDAALATIKGEADQRIAPHEAELHDIVQRLKPWWAVAGDELTEGKRKSLELGGCLIGVRLSNPSLAYKGKKIDKNSEDAAIAAVEAADGLDHYLRIKTELDKQLLLAALAKDDADVLQLGFTRKQREEFFVDWLSPKEATAEVADAAEEPAS